MSHFKQSKNHPIQVLLQNVLNLTLCPFSCSFLIFATLCEGKTSAKTLLMPACLRNNEKALALALLFNIYSYLVPMCRGGADFGRPPDFGNFCSKAPPGGQFLCNTRPSAPPKPHTAIFKLGGLFDILALFSLSKINL